MLRAGRYVAGVYKGGGYGGEAIEKKLARLFFWLAVRDLLGAKRFLEGRYLALASEEAGDAMTLHGLGVPWENIVLAEINKTACLASRKKVPLIAVYNEDVLFTAHRFPAGYFEAVFLDYCGNVTEECLIRSAAIAQRCVSERGMLGIGVHVGRENDLAKMPDLKSAFLKRAGYIKQEMKIRAQLHPHCLFGYTALHPRRHVPMCVYLGTRNKTKCREIVLARGEDAKGVLARWFKHFDQQGLDVSQIFNIPRSSVAPMRAHITRGTYDNQGGNA